MAGNRDDLQIDAAKVKDRILFQGHQSAGLQSAALEFLRFREPEVLVMQLEVSGMHPGFLKEDIAENMINMPVGVHDCDRKFGQFSDDLHEVFLSVRGVDQQGPLFSRDEITGGITRVVDQDDVFVDAHDIRSISHTLPPLLLVYLCIFASGCIS